MHRVEENLARITGQNWKVRCELREQSADSPTTLPEAPPAPQGPVSEPLLDKAQMTFNARLLKIDDGFGEKRQEPTESDDETIDPDWQDQEEV